MRAVIFLGLLVIMSVNVYSQSKMLGNSNFSDKEQITIIENTWLHAPHNKTVLDSLLASDFIHPVEGGYFLTKDQHIGWAIGYPASKNLILKFDTLFVRVYNNNTGIANGIVSTHDSTGQLVRKSVFTDVFIKRNNKWEAVNAQENIAK